MKKRYIPILLVLLVHTGGCLGDHEPEAVHLNIACYINNSQKNPSLMSLNEIK